MLQTRQDLIHGLELVSFILSSRQTKNNTRNEGSQIPQEHGAVIKNIIT